MRKNQGTDKGVLRTYGWLVFGGPSEAKLLAVVSRNLNLTRDITVWCIVMSQGHKVVDGKTEDGISFYRELTESRLTAKAQGVN